MTQYSAFRAKLLSQALVEEGPLETLCHSEPSKVLETVWQPSIFTKYQEIVVPHGWARLRSFKGSSGPVNGHSFRGEADSSMALSGRASHQVSYEDKAAKSPMASHDSICCNPAEPVHPRVAQVTHTPGKEGVCTLGKHS